MESTWISRELPVLTAVVQAFEAGLGALPNVADLAEATGIDKLQVALALKAMDGLYLNLHLLMSGGDPSPWFVDKIYPAARVAVGQWPSPEGLANQLVDLVTETAEREGNPERKSVLSKAAGLLGGASRDILVDIAAAVVTKQSGLG